MLARLLGGNRQHHYPLPERNHGRRATHRLQLSQITITAYIRAKQEPEHSASVLNRQPTRDGCEPSRHSPLKEYTMKIKKEAERLLAAASPALDEYPSTIEALELCSFDVQTEILHLEDRAAYREELAVKESIEE